MGWAAFFRTRAIFRPPRRFRHAIGVGAYRISNDATAAIDGGFSTGRWRYPAVTASGGGVTAGFTGVSRFLCPCRLYAEICLPASSGGYSLGYRAGGRSPTPRLVTTVWVWRWRTCQPTSWRPASEWIIPGAGRTLASGGRWIIPSAFSPSSACGSLPLDCVRQLAFHRANKCFAQKAKCKYHWLKQSHSKNMAAMLRCVASGTASMARVFRGISSRSGLRHGVRSAVVGRGPARGCAHAIAVCAAARPNDEDGCRNPPFRAVTTECVLRGCAAWRRNGILRADKAACAGKTP